jgi:hypothetical protein
MNSSNNINSNNFILGVRSESKKTNNINNKIIIPSDTLISHLQKLEDEIRSHVKVILFNKRLKMK